MTQEEMVEFFKSEISNPVVYKNSSFVEVCGSRHGDQVCYRVYPDGSWGEK